MASALALTACSEAAQARPADRGGDALPPSSATSTGTIASEAVRYVATPTGNAARYRVREQLVGRDLPNDAVGETKQVTGSIAFDSAGAITADSRFVVETGALTSDSDRRDGYVRRRILETEQFPTVTLVPRSVRGLPPGAATGATSGPLSFELTGDLTIRGVTRPTTWSVTARREGERVTGRAVTRFTFDEFALTQPRVRVVLSVADTITLEYDFSLTKADEPE